MKVTAGRHVRHDWKTFVDWDQKSVRTLCGVTTKRHLAGIPGVSIQPSVVPVGSRQLWGWCTLCVVRMSEGFEAFDNLYMVERQAPQISMMYGFAAEAVREQEEYILAQAANKRGKSAQERKV